MPEEKSYRQKDDLQPHSRFWQRTDNFCMPHYHQALELHYVVSGEIAAFIDGIEHHVSAGQLLIVSGYSLHFIAKGHASDTIISTIPLHFLPSLNAQLSQHQFAKLIDTNPDETVIEALKYGVAHMKDMSLETLRGLTLFIVGKLIDTVGLVEYSPTMTGETVHQIVNYLQVHYNEALSLSQLAEVVGYSSSRLSHLFHDYFHRSFNDYVNLLRCREAASLLKNTDDSSLDIGYSVGFGSLRSFYRAFEKYYGMPPKKFRILRRGQINNSNIFDIVTEEHKNG